MPDYSKGKIYKITNDFNNEIYIGSTCDTLVKRYSKHKSDSKNEDRSNIILYKLINEIGFDRFRIELICDYPCDDKYQLLQKESEYIRELGTLNMVIPNRTVQEHSKDYYIKNKTILNAKHQEYYEQHSEYIKEHKKEYRNNMSEEQKKKTHERKREKITCECGCITARSDIAKHMKTPKHINLMNDLNSNII